MYGLLCWHVDEAKYEDILLKKNIFAIKIIATCIG